MARQPLAAGLADLMLIECVVSSLAYIFHIIFCLSFVPVNIPVKYLCALRFPSSFFLLCFPHFVTRPIIRFLYFLSIFSLFSVYFD